MAVPGLFQRPPNSRAPCPVKALLACFRLVIRQAVAITKRFRAPAVRSGFRPHGPRARYGHRREEPDRRALSGEWLATSLRPPPRLQTNLRRLRIWRRCGVAARIHLESVGGKPCVGPGFAPEFRSWPPASTRQDRFEIRTSARS